MKTSAQPRRLIQPRRRGLLRLAPPAQLHDNLPPEQGAGLHPPFSAGSSLRADLAAVMRSLRDVTGTAPDSPPRTLLDILLTCLDNFVELGQLLCYEYKLLIDPLSMRNFRRLPLVQILNDRIRTPGACVLIMRGSSSRGSGLPPPSKPWQLTDAPSGILKPPGTCGYANFAHGACLPRYHHEVRRCQGNGDERHPYEPTPTRNHFELRCRSA